MSDVPQIAESPQSEVDEMLATLEKKAKKNPAAFNAFSFLEVIKAMRKEYNEGFDATFEAIRQATADGTGDIEIVEKAQKVVGELMLFVTGLLKGAGALDDNGQPTDKMPPELREAYDLQTKSVSEFLTDSQAFLEDALDEDDEDDDEDDEDEDEDEDDEDEVPTVAAPPAPAV